jgi:two-component system CheB/CheR fusion protein
MNDNAPFPVVGIGASTGGLRALEDFFKSFPADPGMAFVAITPLAPDHESFLTEILARGAHPPVQAARDGQKVEANRVHVLPSNVRLTIAVRRPSLHETGSGRRESKPIDNFFASLALD